MSSRVEYATSCVPVATVNAEASGDNSAFSTIAYEVQRSLGGKGSVPVGFTTVTGYNNGGVVYQSAAVSGGAISYFQTDYEFIHIKHMGNKFSSSSVLGVSTSANLRVYIYNYQLDSSLLFFVLPPKASIVIPVGPDLNGTANYIGILSSSATDTVATEILGVI